MNIYLAARYSRHLEMQSIRSSLELIGHTVTSSWIDIGGRSFTLEELENETDRCAVRSRADIEDIKRCDCLVFVSDQGGKGGRHVEFGIALAMEKRIVVVGHRENVFHSIIHEVVQTYEELFDLLSV